MRKGALFLTISLFISVFGFRASSKGVAQHHLEGKLIDWVSPDHVHLSLTGQQDEMVVMFSTPYQAEKPVVEFWYGDHRNIAHATTYNYTLGNYTSAFIHTAKMSQLHPDTLYWYRCGEAGKNSKTAWSPIYQFRTEPTSTAFSFVVVADHGNTLNSRKIFATMQREMDSSNYQLIIVPGDISYANSNQYRWDDYHYMTSPLTSRIPWMISPGNHENEQFKKKNTNFLAFRQRFAMPWKQSGGTDGNMFYSFNYGSVHFISLNSEARQKNFTEQAAWLKRDLSEVNHTRTPWIIAYVHTPPYCTNKVHLNEGKAMRSAFEQDFYDYGVDLVFSGHVHAYERTNPVFKGKNDKNGPVYIVNGAGGNEEGLVDKWADPTEWSAFRQAKEWGIGRVHVYNSTHLTYEFKNIDRKIVDSVWIVRERQILPVYSGCLVSE